MSQDLFKTVLRDRVAKTAGGATQIREMANIMDNTEGLDLQPLHLALQYLIGVDILPLRRTMTIVGREGSGKSVFAWYLSTLFAKNKGFINFVDAEAKTSFDQVSGVYAAQGLHHLDWYARFAPKSQEQMLEHLTVMYTEITKVIKDPKNVREYGAPLLYLVDSIHCLAPEDRVQQRLEDNEHNAVGYSNMHKASALTEYLQAFAPNCISSWPALFIAINHEKEQADQGGGKPSYGPKKTYEPGGKHKEFMYSINIAMSKNESMADHYRDTKRQGMVLKTKKSCFSEVGRSIGLIMETTQAVLPDNSSGIHVNFDWARALVDILADGTRGWGDGKAVVSADAIKDILSIKRDSKESCTCSTFGMSKESPTDVGLRIIQECENDPEFYKKLQKALWIFPKHKYDRSLWVPPSDDKMNMEELRKVMPIQSEAVTEAPVRRKPKA